MNFWLVNDEERNPRDLMPLRQFPGFLDHIHSIVTVQHGFGSFSVQSGFSSHVNECLTIADIPAISEVGSKKCFDNRILTAMLVSKPDNPVSINSIWRSFNLIECEIDAFCLADSNDFAIQFQRVAVFSTSRRTASTFSSVGIWTGRKTFDQTSGCFHEA